MAATQGRLHAASHVLAATVGTSPVALLLCAAIARFLPVSADSRYAIAYAALTPTWLIVMCLAFVARQATRVWITSLLICVVLGSAVYGVPHDSDGTAHCGQ